MKELLLSFHRISLVLILGWQDIRGRYRRSIIGPFWLTISMGVMISSIGIVFGHIFNTTIDEFLPFLAVGIILWAFITGIINEGCTVFIDSEEMIKQLNIPFFVYIFRVLWRNILILAHNILILPIVFLVMDKSIETVALWAIPGLFLVALSLSWMAMLFGILCVRYRDLPQIIASVLQVAFYLTPIIWMPALLPGRIGLNFLQLNPFYHLLEIVRAPLLGTQPSMISWYLVLGIAIVGWGLTLFFFSRLRHRVAYWL